MLDESSYIRLLVATLKRGSILTLKGDIPFQSEKRHHFVILNYNPRTAEYLVAVNNTSQVISRLTHLGRQSGTDVNGTTVVFSQNQYDFFPEQTLFDCNTVHEITAAELATAHSLGNLSVPSNDVALSEEDLEAIIQATLNSRSVSPINKKMIKPDYNNS